MSLTPGSNRIKKFVSTFTLHVLSETVHYGSRRAGSAPEKAVGGGGNVENPSSE